MKKWFQSTTIWSDILTLVLAIYAGALPVAAAHGVVLPPLTSPFLVTVLTILAGMGIRGRVVANGPIVK